MAGLPQRAEDLVGRYVQKAEPGRTIPRQRHPVAPGLGQHRERADDIRLHEVVRRIDGAINVRLCREMEYRSRLVALDRRANRGSVAHVESLEVVVRKCFCPLERVGVRCVGELVDVRDGRLPPNQGTDHGGPNEASAPGDQVHGFSNAGFGCADASGGLVMADVG
jgi:hypothetical protein